MILGLIVQSESALPIYHEIFSDKIIEFSKEKVDNLLTSGFLSAIITFAGEYNQDIDFIRFRSRKDKKIFFNALIGKIEKLTFICFTEPYVFSNEVFRKIKWIYEYNFKKYITDLKKNKIPKITNDDKEYIKDLLTDKFLKERIKVNEIKIKETIRNLSYEIEDEILEFAICSFDNSILYQNFKDSISRLDLEYMLNDFGRGGLLKSQEIQYKPVWFPDDREPLLLCVANSGLMTSFDEITGISIDGELPYYYYIITEMESTIGPIMNNVMFSINKVLLTY